GIGRGVVAGGEQVADLVAEGVVAGDAVPVRGGEGGARRRADPRGQAAGGGVVDHQHAHAGGVRVAGGMDAVHEAVAGPAVAAEVGAEAVALGVAHLRLVGERHGDGDAAAGIALVGLGDRQVDQPVDVAGGRGGGRRVVDHHPDVAVGRDFHGTAAVGALRHADDRQLGVLGGVVGRRGVGVHRHDGVAAGAERPDLVE